MKEDIEVVEKRLKNVKSFYLKTSKLINNLPDGVPDNIKNQLEKIILGDKELKDLMESIDSNRPPKIFLIGRTGVGKSSLINALCGAYLAKVSDTVSCTSKTEIYQCKKGNKTIMEILDTRGIAESSSLDENQSAEELLVEDMMKFSPDVAILMLNGVHRDDVDEDVMMMKKLADKYNKINSVELPVIVVINKCDEVAPSRYKVPKEFPESKLNNIQEIKKYFKEIIIKNGLKTENIISVSSLIDWQTKDGIEVGMDDIKNLSQSEIDNLQIAFDGRYNIDKLLDALENSIVDASAKMGLRMAARLNQVVRSVAKKLNTIFSGMSSAVALTPIPVSDIYILLVIQATLVTLIASLSGREIDLDTAKEFIFSMGGVAGLGYTFKLIAQQGVKLLNALTGVGGSVISSGIAYAGTYSIGESAIAYYIDNKDMKSVKKIFDKLKKERK